MKKTLSLILLPVLGLFFLSCGQKTEAEKKQEDGRILLSATELAMAIGQEETLTASISGLKNNAVYWTCDDVVKMTENLPVGNSSSVSLLARKDGQATLTVASVFNATVRASCTVTVSTKRITAINVREADRNITMEKGKSATVQVGILPGDADNPVLDWKSSNSSLLSIEAMDANAHQVRLTASSSNIGTATVTVSSKDGGQVSQTLSVNVIAQIIPVTGFTVTPSATEGVSGVTYPVSINWTPSNTTQKGYTAVSNNPNITVSNPTENGFNVIGNAGTATITVTSTDKPSLPARSFTITLYAGNPEIEILWEEMEDFYKKEGGTRYIHAFVGAESRQLRARVKNTSKTGVTWSRNSGYSSYFDVTSAGALTGKSDSGTQSLGVNCKAADFPESTVSPVNINVKVHPAPSSWTTSVTNERGYSTGGSIDLLNDDYNTVSASFVGASKDQPYYWLDGHVDEDMKDYVTIERSPRSTSLIIRRVKSSGTNAYGYLYIYPVGYRNNANWVKKISVSYKK